MADGAFTPAAREAVLTRTNARCAGCGTTSPMTVQHRLARGMGGTRRAEVSHPANGLALCGSGTTGCHGWTERNPMVATLLGWRIVDTAEVAVGVPYWTSQGAWRWCWVDADASCRWFDPEELDQATARQVAVAVYLDDLRAAGGRL